ncbi:hypothetical protein Csa_014970 [Cucumis sativus]|uniref:Uncharacterized protein n=1 Tax=Cucumis sativus TaxID=3659 RepID=A0A0A0KVA7_CUCSA|nr:hypothetical protein Csa_014970 [Cucumis sativus]
MEEPEDTRNEELRGGREKMEEFKGFMGPYCDRPVLGGRWPVFRFCGAVHTFLSLK